MNEQNTEPKTIEEAYLKSIADMIDSVFLVNPQLKSLSMEEYRSSHALSRSDIIDLLRSPAYYNYKRSIPNDPTPAMLFGQAVHTRLLEPHLFSNLYCYAPKIDRRPKAGKAEFKKFVNDNSDKIILDKDWQIIIENIGARIDIAQWLEENTNGQVYIEPSIFFNNEGVDCKARPDIVVVHKDAIVIVDLKTTENASKKSFEKTISKYSYHIQAEFYTSALKSVYADRPVYFYFLAIEKKSPYDYAVFALDDKYYEVARKQIYVALNRYKNAVENGFSGYTKSVQIVEPPVWLEYQAMEEGE